MIDWNSLPRVQAPLTFVASGVSARQQFFQPPEIPPAGENMQETHQVDIHNVRPVLDQLSLAREGFVVGKLDAEISNYRDREQINGVWVPSVKRMLQGLTGAAAVVTWAQGARFSEKLAQSKDTPVSAPARMVHTDFSPGPLGAQIDNRPVDEVIAEVTGSSRKRKWQFYNVWQAISPAPLDEPLALCDSSSTEGDDFVSAFGKANYADGRSVDIEVCWVKYRPRQRWAFVPDLGLDEALVFCGLDLNAGPTCHRVPHSAFTNPACPPGTPPRNSLEVRALVILD